MIIHSNGSNWCGEEVADLETLNIILQKYTLDPMFLDFGGFITDNEEDLICLFGNFHDLSHVFRIEGTREELKETMTLILKNIETEKFKQARKEYYTHKISEKIKFSNIFEPIIKAKHIGENIKYNLVEVTTLSDQLYCISLDKFYSSMLSFFINEYVAETSSASERCAV
jgi:hypothetical protein